MTVHDIANHILENISQSKSSQQKYLRLILDHSCKIADRIIVPSIATKNDLVEHFDVDPRKISVIYEGGDKEINVKPAGEQELKEKYQIKSHIFCMLEHSSLEKILKRSSTHFCALPKKS